MKIKSPKKNIAVHVSDNIDDIIEINDRSTETKTPIRITELSSLSNIIPQSKAELIRRKLLKNKVKVMQLTNQRAFQPWTKVRNFVKTCMNIRYVSPDILPINTEVLIYDNVVAVYQVEPNISVTIIENEAFTAQQRALFDNFWSIASPLALGKYGSTTFAVTIKRSPQEVYDYISDLANWSEFSDFAADFERITDEEYIAHTSQGDVRVIALFDRKRMLLDTRCILSDGEVQTIPYRVVPNIKGSELMMTNFRPKSASKKDYDEQLYWMEVELKRIKEILEKKKSFKKK